MVKAAEVPRDSRGEMEPSDFTNQYGRRVIAEIPWRRPRDFLYSQYESRFVGNQTIFFIAVI